MNVRAWCVDVAVAYGGGIIFGAPLGLAALWLTGHDAALGGVIVLAMIGLLIGRRLWRSRGSRRERSVGPHPFERVGRRSGPPNPY